jgi:hypothetical protein
MDAEVITPEIEVIELQKKILDLENALLAEKQKVLESDQKTVKAVNSMVTYKEINTSLTDFKDIAHQEAILNYQIKLINHELTVAKQFSEARAFGDYKPEQIYSMMKAGQEMGLKPIESLQLLYIVNGKIRPYGDKMIAIITKHGYKIKYLDESPKGVTVKVTHENGFDESEIVRSDDQILQNSKAAKFAPFWICRR